MEDRYSAPKMTDKEWIELDRTSVREMCVEKVRELREDIGAMEDSIEEAYREYFAEKRKSKTDSFDLWVRHLFIVDVHLEKELQRKKSKLAYFNSLLIQSKGDTPHNNNITAVDIERAKEYPLEALLPELKPAGSKKMKCSCPFHEDRTPSFIVYLESNSFYCFSCQVGGNPIDFVIKSEGLEFIEAVRRLSTH